MDTMHGTRECSGDYMGHELSRGHAISSLCMRLDMWLLVKKFSKPLGQPSLSTTHRMCICTFAHTNLSFPPSPPILLRRLYDNQWLDLRIEHTAHMYKERYWSLLHDRIPWLPLLVTHGLNDIHSFHRRVLHLCLYF